MPRKQAGALILATSKCCQMYIGMEKMYPKCFKAGDWWVTWLVIKSQNTRSLFVDFVNQMDSAPSLHLHSFLQIP